MHKNNLYGHAKSKSFPLDGLKWFNLAKFHLDKYDDNSFRGCILEVDLEYSRKLHKLHNNSPLAPDKLEIKRDI